MFVTDLVRSYNTYYAMNKDIDDNLYNFSICIYCYNLGCNRDIFCSIIDVRIFWHECIKDIWEIGEMPLRHPKGFAIIHKPVRYFA